MFYNAQLKLKNCERDFMKAKCALGAGVISLLIVFIAWGCGSKDDQTDSGQQSALQNSQAVKGFTGKLRSDPGYEAWREYKDDYLTVFCPPDDGLIDRTPAIAEKIKQIFMENSMRLQVQIPKPFTFYLYNNTNEIQELTDCEYTCVQGNTVHYMVFTPLGEPIMVRLLQEFDPNGTPCTFCQEGVVTVLNYSGKNYVEEAYIDYFNDQMPSLEQLLDPQVYPTLDSIHRCKAAAGLTQFLLTDPYNPEMFLSVYKSEQDPKIALENMYKLPLDQLEKNWIEFLKQNSGLNVEY